MSDRPLDVVMIGAGVRGTYAYGSYIRRHPDEVRVVAVVDPDEVKRARLAALHDVPPDRCFADWHDLPETPLAPAAIVTTPDRQHVAPAVWALRTGYHLLLEKPMSVTPADCIAIVQAAEETRRVLTVCHVLRYTPLFSTLHEIVRSGRLGQVVQVDHRENLAYWHYAHSYVRGNWRNSALSAPMILTKCCHDLDILAWTMPPVVRLHSTGSLLHFRPENAPPDAPERCTDGCPVAESCPFYAPRIYLGKGVGWPQSAISVHTSQEGLLHALQTGPYGRCVYHCDNDVVDHQVVAMEHADGAISTLTMQGHSHREGRTIRFDGTRATLRASFQDGEPPEITVHDHLTNSVEAVPLPDPEESGHGGGDAGVMRAFLQAVHSGGATNLTDGRASLESHLLAFAAEESRLSGGQPVEMDGYRQRIERTLKA